MSQEMRPAGEPVAPAGRWAWLADGVRSAVFLRPRRLQADVGPWAVAGLMLAGYALAVAIQRLMMDGEVRFYWPAISWGWLSSFLMLWLCWLVVRSAAGPTGGAARVATLFAVLTAQRLCVSVPAAMLSLLVLRFGPEGTQSAGHWIHWGISAAVLGWLALASVWLLARQAGCWRTRIVVMLVVLLNVALYTGLRGPSFWYPAPEDTASAEAEPEPETFRLTQEVMEAQSATLVEALDAVGPQRSGRVDLYTITFAPYADEDVFSRETAMVSEVMRTRFDAAGHQVQLQNHRGTAASMPWATPLNLQRAIERAAQRMDPDEDILFLHLTSHGARSGQLSAGFHPVEVDELTPQQLRGWLDAAGIRHSVVSISACFSGSWIAPLGAPGTLVMTAADAEHTSYGCGRKSPLTFFGRAMYDEQLRLHTRSFEAAHAAARKLIEQREKEAGKSDGYSNPQIAMGAQIRERLARLEAELAALP